MMLSKVLPSTSFSRGSPLAPSLRASCVRPFRAAEQRTVTVKAEKLNLGNLSPEEGSRRKDKRKGRGHAAGQGKTAGYGKHGQKSRSGRGPRPGFEGGQTPMYRRLPKLRGIAGGNPAGIPDFVTVNLSSLEKHFQANEEVTLEALEAKRVMACTGRERDIPLKVLGTGNLTKPLVVKAAAFSKSAMEKIAAAGGKAEELAQKAKWTRAAHEAAVAAAKPAEPAAAKAAGKAKKT